MVRQFTAPATTTVTASASDPDGTVTKVDFYANGVADRHRHDEPLQRQLGGRRGGTYNLTAVATDDRMFTTTSAHRRSVTVGAAPSRHGAGERRAGVKRRAASPRRPPTAAAYAACFAIDGESRSDRLGKRRGLTKRPARSRTGFGSISPAPKPSTKSTCSAVQGNGSVDPTARRMTSTRTRSRDFQVQYWTGSAVVRRSGRQRSPATIAVWRQFTFAPLTTTAIRVLITRQRRRAQPCGRAGSIQPADRTSSTAAPDRTASNVACRRKRRRA